MNRREYKKADWYCWGHDSAKAPSRGYLRRCHRCGSTIYIKLDCDGSWRPYESWLDGVVEENQWRLHECGGPLRIAA